MMRLAFALCAAAFAAPAWSANKCTIDGRVVYQDQPCPGTGMSVAEDMANKQAARERAMKAREEAAKNPPKPVKDEYQLQYEARIRAIDEKVAAAKAKCASFPSHPVIGMKEEQFLQCTYFGLAITPESINQTETAAGVAKQYVYRTVGDIKYLYTRNGVVTAIQK